MVIICNHVPEYSQNVSAILEIHGARLKVVLPSRHRVEEPTNQRTANESETTPWQQLPRKKPSAHAPRFFLNKTFYEVQGFHILSLLYTCRIHFFNLLHRFTMDYHGLSVGSYGYLLRIEIMWLSWRMWDQLHTWPRQQTFFFRKDRAVLYLITSTPRSGCTQW